MAFDGNNLLKRERYGVTAGASVPSLRRQL